MSKVILICGRICSGKSTYANELRSRAGGVILSVDEVMLSLFGQHCGDMHDEYSKRTKKYLLEKSLEISGLDINIILDWGFWKKYERENIKLFYKEHGIDCEIHFIDIDDETWNMRLNKRNREVREGKTVAYYVDTALVRKFEAAFEMPEKDEIDVWITCI